MGLYLRASTTTKLFQANYKSRDIRHSAIIVNVCEHPSVTDPAEPDPVDYSPLPSKNLASPVPSEYFDFTQLFLCFPSDCAVRFENPSVFLKTNKPTKKIVKINQKLLQKLACLASVSVGFGSKERPRNGIFGVFVPRKMVRETKNERGG